MNEWVLLLLASTVGSLFSLVGGMFLLAGKLPIARVQRIAVPFAAGALLAAALLDLIPEALEHEAAPLVVMVFVLCGFVLFFVLERFLGWFHHHHDDQRVSASHKREQRKRSTRSLIVVGDTLHNAIDGMVIGAAFLADPTVGLITTIAIAAHEIPQEIGDFGVLLALGMRRRSVLLVNILSAVATVIAAVAVYSLGSVVSGIEPVLLALAAGMFIYIAASDLVPTIHEEQSSRVANFQTVILLFGLVLVGLTTTITHQLLEGVQGHDHTHESSHTHD